MFLKCFSFIIIFNFIFCSCIEENIQYQSQFNLSEDYTNFSETIENQDTLSIFVSKSVCEYRGYDIIEIIKLNDSIFLQITEHSIMNEKQLFPKIHYNLSENQPKLEDLFCKLHTSKMLNDSVNLNHKLSQLTIKHKNSNQKIELYTNGLAHTGKSIAFYDTIMSNFYPKELPLKTFLIINSE